VVVRDRRENPTYDERVADAECVPWAPGGISALHGAAERQLRLT
jgi:hypothetical protein